MGSPFDFVKSVCETKEYIYSDDTEKDYQPFIINKALSFNIQDLFLASEINKYSSIPKKSQYDFYLNSLDKGRRSGRWVKKDSFPEDLAFIKEVFNYNNDQSIAALNIIGEDELLELKKLYNKGGRK